MRRPQFSIRALLILMLVVGAFFGGIKFERERRIREERASQAPVAATPSMASPYGPPGTIVQPFDMNRKRATRRR